MPIAAPKKSSTHFEAFFEYATMGIVVTDNRGIIHAVNPFALNEFGYTEIELIGKVIEILVPARFHHQHIPHREKYLQQPFSRAMGAGIDLVALKKDGTEIPVEISLGNYHTNNGIYVITFITNITIRKKAEAEIEKMKAQLESTVDIRTKALMETMHQLELSNDKLEAIQSFQKALLDNAGAMIIATDENGIIKLFNPEASANIGYHESEVINKYTTLLFHNKTEIAKKREEILNESGIMINAEFEVLVEKSRRNIHDEEQYTYARKDGSTFPVLLTITTIRDCDGKINGYMGIAIDISERKKAEEDLLVLLKKEQDLGELKSGFVSMASHEFRTPLSTVLSSAYLIEKYTSGEDQPKREKHLQRIVSSVNMLTDMLNDFLSVGKIEEGKIQVRLTEFNIKKLVKTIAGEMKLTLGRQQKIHYRHDGDAVVTLDPSLLKHIIMNLVSNAGKFSNEKYPIELKTTNNGQQVTLSVKDHGMGISNDDQKHLMERFFRGTNAGNIQGTGLGLHLVSKYAELMNGKMEFKSQLEKGSEFKIVFTALPN